MNRLPTGMLALLLLLTGTATAQNSTVDWFTVSGGFGSASASGSTIEVILGQPLQGSVIGSGSKAEFGLFVDTLLAPLLLAVDAGHLLPSAFALSQNFPNPFNPTTTIQFEVSHPEVVTIKVFDVVGREVATLVNEFLQPGSYSRTWNATMMASGVYFYRLRAKDFTMAKRMVLIR